jgi:hypothetical protein
MFHARRDEQDVTRTERMAHQTIGELPASRNDDIQFVASMGSLGVAAPRSIEVDLEAPSFEGQDESLAVGPGQALHHVCDAEGKAIIRHEILLAANRTAEGF